MRLEFGHVSDVVLSPGRTIVTQEKKVDTAQQKRAWDRPQLQRLEAGSAESQAGSTPDGGGGAQGS